MSEIIPKLPIEAWLGLIALFVFIGLAFILTVGAQIHTAIKSFRGEAEARVIGPQPFEVKSAVEYATKGEVQVVAAEVQAVDADLKNLRKEITENGEKRRQSIEAKVETLAKENHKHTENVRKELSDKIDAMPSQVIATLKNTGAI